MHKAQVKAEAASAQQEAGCTHVFGGRPLEAAPPPAGPHCARHAVEAVLGGAQQVLLRPGGNRTAAKQLVAVREFLAMPAVTLG